MHGARPKPGLPPMHAAVLTKDWPAHKKHGEGATLLVHGCHLAEHRRERAMRGTTEDDLLSHMR